MKKVEAGPVAGTGEKDLRLNILPHRKKQSTNIWTEFFKEKGITVSQNTAIAYLDL